MTGRVSVLLRGVRAEPDGQRPGYPLTCSISPANSATDKVRCPPSGSLLSRTPIPAPVERATGDLVRVGEDGPAGVGCSRGELSSLGPADALATGCS
jgi:hypothetical protein